MVLLSVTIATTIRHLDRYLRHCLFAMTGYCAIYGFGSLLFPDAFNIDRSSVDAVVHPTALGATASLDIVLSVALLTRTSSPRWMTATLCLGLPAFILALIVSHNRLSLALTFVFGFALFFVRGRSHVLAGLGVAACGCGLAYVVVDPGFVLVDTIFGSSVEFFNRGQSATQLTQLSGRAEMWTKMWKSYLDSPIVGHGYFVSSKTGKIFVWFEEANHTAHNIVLQALVSTGIIGTAIYLTWTLKIMQMMSFNWLRGAGVNTTELSFSENNILAFSVMFWFLGWTMLNASILGPVRPESVVFAIVAGAIAGQYHWLCRHSENSATTMESARSVHPDVSPGVSPA